MGLIDRRRFLAVLGGSAAGLGAASRAVAAAAQTLWMLDPDWGVPLETQNGTDIKSRCRGRACHLAAPHRFFLTEADALAGRLHPCCLARAVAVTVHIDLNALMPYYRARRGGVDARCPELPTGLRDALYGAQPRSTPTTPHQSPTIPAQPDAIPPGDDHQRAVPARNDTSPPPNTPVLPATGIDLTGAVVAAGILTAAGTVAVRSTTGDRGAC